MFEIHVLIIKNRPQYFFVLQKREQINIPHNGFSDGNGNLTAIYVILLLNPFFDPRRLQAATVMQMEIC